MDHRKLYGVAAILLSGAVFVHSLKTANAVPQGPNVSMGTNPIVNFRGSVTGYSGDIITTVPSDQSLIVTTILTSAINSGSLTDGSYCDTYVDGVKIIDGNNAWTFINNRNSSFWGARDLTPFKIGQAKLKIDPGSSLEMRATGANTIICNYYIEGYYMH